MRCARLCLSMIVLLTSLCCSYEVSGAHLAAAATAGCRTGNPIAHVSDAASFKLLSPCVSVTGVVKNVKRVGGGAYQVDVLLDRAYRHMLSAANVSRRHGWLLLEVTAPDAAHRITVFGVGAHIRVVGALLLNRNHGWSEIYPVWSIQRVGKIAPKPSGGAGGGACVQPPPAPPPAPAPLALRVIVTPAVMPRAYSHAVATAYTQAGANCTASLNYDHASNPLGALFGFAAQTAGADGTVTWTWGLDFTITGGGSVTVTCTRDGNTATAVGRFTIG
jgi:hypothetical protein